nr:hypothetical protein [Tanacetum cinerariifolium]
MAAATMLPPRPRHHPHLHHPSRTLVTMPPATILHALPPPTAPQQQRRLSSRCRRRGGLWMVDWPPSPCPLGAARRQTTIVVAVGRRYSHHCHTLWCRAVMTQPLVKHRGGQPPKTTAVVAAEPTIATTAAPWWCRACGVKTVNDDVQIRALVDGKKLIVNEASIRRDLKLEDAEGTGCLPNDTIFEELTRMGFVQVFVNHQLGDMSHHKKIFVTPSLTKKRKETEVPHTEPQTEEIVPTTSNDPLPSGEDRMQLIELMNLCTKLQKQVLDLEKANTAQAKEIVDLKKGVKKLKRKKKSRTSGLKRLWKVGSNTRVESSEDKESLGDQEDASKQGSMINNIDQDRKETEVPHTEPQTEEIVPTTSNDPLPSGEDRMQLIELMNLCTKLQKQVLDLEKANTAQAKEIVDLKKGVKKLKRKKKSRTSGLKRLWKVGSTTRVESSKDKESLGDQEDESKQGSMINNIDQDVEITLVDKTQARMNEEDMFGVNDLDGDEVIMDVTTGENVEQDETVAEKEVSTADPVTTAGEVVTTVEDVEARGVIVQEPSEFKTTSSLQPSQLPQAKDQGKGIIVELEKPLKKKDQITSDEEVARKLEAHMKAKIEEEERLAREKDEANIAPKNLKKNSVDEIQKLFDSVMKRVNTFVDINTEIVEERSKKTQAEVTEGSSKRAGDELKQESAKRQKLEKEDDSAELKRCLEIVPGDDDDVTIEATPLSSKSPTIVDYKIYKEGKKSYFKIIRADGNSQYYLTFGKMFKNFNIEDLYFKEYTLRDYYCWLKTYCCWYKLKLLDNAVDSRLRLNRYALSFNANCKPIRVNPWSIKGSIWQSLSGFGFYPRLLAPYISLKDKDLQESKDPQVVVSPTKLPILNPNEFDLWKMRIEQYFFMTDYSLWEVILNGDSPIPKRVIDGVVQPFAPTTAEQSLKIYEVEVKSSSTASPTTQNISFVSSQNTDSTNESVNAVTSVFVASTKVCVSTLLNVDTLSDAVIYSFFASQSNSPLLDNDDLKHIDANDLEEIDLKWQMAMLTMRARRRRHFARECRSTKDARRNVPVETKRRNVPVETSTSNALVTQYDGMGSYDWSFQIEEKPTNYALMAFTSSSSSSYDNELRDNALVELRKKFEKVEQERDELKLKLDKFQTSSKNLSHLLASQTNDKTGLGYNNQVFSSSVFDCNEMFSSKSDVSFLASLVYDRYKSGEGYHVVPPLYTGTFMLPKPNLVFHNAPTVNETVPTAFNVELSSTKPDKIASSFVQPTKHVKNSRPSVKPVEQYAPSENLRKDSPTSRGHRNSRNQKSCFVCKSLTYLIKDCDYYEKMVQKPVRHVVPIIVLTRSRLVPLNAARPINTAVPQTNVTRPRPAKTVNAVKGVKGNWGNPQHALKDKVVIDSGCSRYMTGNMSYLTDFKEINGGYVAFGGNPKGGKITRKGKIRTG